MNTQKDFLNVKEASKYVGKHMNTINNHIKAENNSLPFQWKVIKGKKTKMIKRADLNKFYKIVDRDIVNNTNEEPTQENTTLQSIQSCTDDLKKEISEIKTQNEIIYDYQKRLKASFIELSESQNIVLKRIDSFGQSSKQNESLSLQVDNSIKKSAPEKVMKLSDFPKDEVAYTRKEFWFMSLALIVCLIGYFFIGI